MSQQPSANENGGSNVDNNTMPNTPENPAGEAIATVSILDSDDEVPIVSEIIDLCISPSTSAAAASSSNSSGNILKNATKPTQQTDVAAGGAAIAPALECPICLQTCIHPARLPCGHIFCFLCVKGVAYKNRRCAMCRREIPPEFLDHPQLVNGIDDICTTKATEDGYQWYYEGRNGGWWAYDKRSNDEIEAAYRANQYTAASVLSLVEDDGGEETLSSSARYNLLICGTIYIIDFLDMVQFPAHNTTRRRKICRVHANTSMPTKGVAGWWQYDDRTSQDIEEAYKKGEKSCTILVAGYVYIVDLEAMVQQRQNEPTRCRRVKRDLATIPKKGVAGLRIEGNTVTTDSNFATQLQQQQQQQQQQQHHQGHSGRNVRLRLHSSDLISTIAATDAAIRIASDIIGSTLAHADELTRGLSVNNIAGHSDESLSSGEHALQSSLSNIQHNPDGEEHTAALRSSAVTLSSSNSNLNTIQDLMRSATEDLLGTTQQVIETNQHSLDLFEQALNDFQELTFRNISDSSDDDEEVLETNRRVVQSEEPAAQQNTNSDDANRSLGF